MREMMDGWEPNDKEGNDTGFLFIRDLDNELKSAFKAWCARRGYSMTAVIQSLMRYVIENN